MNRFGDLYLEVAVESELRRPERVERDVDLEAMPEDVASVDYFDVITLWLCREVERVGEGVVLEQESMVGRDEDVRGVGVGQLLHEVDDVAQGILNGLEDLPLG